MNAPDIRNEDHSTYNSKNDKRLTHIGKFLRNLSIDETPQILNVLRHEMSIVGPRPDLPEHLENYEEQEKTKLQILPGITGYNQAYYRNNIEWKARLANDVYYVEHLSFWLDVKIFFKTIECIFRRRGIFMVPKIGKASQIRRLSGDNYVGYFLDWDTTYFKVKCARVDLYGNLGSEDKKKILEYCNYFEFVTIANLGNKSENNLWIGKETQAFLADVNIQFIKKIEHEPGVTTDRAKVYCPYEGNEKIKAIARSAFLYSRFFQDSRLTKEQSAEVYQKWIENAFSKQDHYFVIADRNQDTAGFILFTMNETEKLAIIELIAVDETFRGQKIGKSLITEMERYLYEKGIHTIKVGTQISNTPAILFYNAMGFRYQGSSTIYHLWRSSGKMSKE